MRAVSPPGFSRGFYAIRLYEKERDIYMCICICRTNTVVVTLPEEFLFFTDQSVSRQGTYRRYFFDEREFYISSNGLDIFVV